MRTRLTRGSSLIELLVVIVVFLVGILAVIQIFPRGLGILRDSRSSTQATQLGVSEMGRLKGLSEQLPEGIVANNDSASATQFFGEIDVDATLDDWVPSDTTGLAQNGVLSSRFSGGDWKEYTGPNRFRGIIGEGRTIPAPRFIPQGANPALYGALMTLNFTPVRVSANPAIDTLQVYGNNLILRETDNIARTRFRDYIGLFDTTANAIYVPQGPFGSPVQRSYRVSISYYFDNAGVRELRSGVFVVNGVNPATAPNNRFYATVDLATFLPGFLDADWDSLRIARLFQPVATFIDDQANPGLRDDAAYQYIPLNYALGQLLFNPAGFNYKELRGRGRLPLVARVDYNVRDWRVIRDDFRVPEGPPYLQKLVMNSLKVLGERDIDNTTYAGVGGMLNLGPLAARDVAIIDSETGAILEPNSYSVDKSNGVVTFIDLDGNSANGMTSDLVFPGQTVATRATDIRNRPMRAYYMTKGEWSVQPVKGASQYFATWGARITWDQCYPGRANGVNGQPYNIYFPLSDVGKRVTIGEIVIDDGAGGTRILRDLEFTILPPETGDLRLGRVDIRPVAGNTATLNFSLGYAVRRVRGVSLSVRVYWNPQYLNLTADSDANLRELDNWLRGLRKSELETILVKESNSQ